jgi:hypothetical protein
MFQELFTLDYIVHRSTHIKQDVTWCIFYGVQHIQYICTFFSTFKHYTLILLIFVICLKFGLINKWM